MNLLHANKEEYSPPVFQITLLRETESQEVTKIY